MNDVRPFVYSPVFTPIFLTTCLLFRDDKSWARSAALKQVWRCTSRETRCSVWPVKKNVYSTVITFKSTQVSSQEHILNEDCISTVFYFLEALYLWSNMAKKRKSCPRNVIYHCCFCTCLHWTPAEAKFSSVFVRVPGLCPWVNIWNAPVELHSVIFLKALHFWNRHRRQKVVFR